MKDQKGRVDPPPIKPPEPTEPPGSEQYREEEKEDSLFQGDLARRKSKSELKRAEQASATIDKSRQQVMYLRWCALGLALLVEITVVVIFLCHQSHFLYGEERAGDLFLVSLVIAPTASITVITVFVVVAVFRVFSDKDAETAMNLAARTGTAVPA